jgi:pantetheine-phosphate adenylyltransferase
MDKAEALFSMPERQEMLMAMTGDLDNVIIDTFEGLLVAYCIKQGANAVLRGIRAISDYEFELQMALMNRKMEPRVETVFMMPAEQYSYLSSRIVREIAKLGGPLQGLVPAMVEERVRERIAQRQVSVPGKHLL